MMPGRMLPLSALLLAPLLLAALPAQAQRLSPVLQAAEKLYGVPPTDPAAALTPAMIAPQYDTPEQRAAQARLPQPPDVPAAETIDPAIQFNTTERWLIPYYFDKIRERQTRANRSNVYDRALPAGIEKQPGIGDRLPLAVLPDLRRLPGPLQRDLPPRRPDTERYIIAQDIVLVRPSSGEVLDIIGGVNY